MSMSEREGRQAAARALSTGIGSGEPGGQDGIGRACRCDTCRVLRPARERGRFAHRAKGVGRGRDPGWAGLGGGRIGMRMGDWIGLRWEWLVVQVTYVPVQQHVGANGRQLGGGRRKIGAVVARGWG